MKITLIITTYNWPESLELVLKSITKQTIFPDEIIVADDGSTKETKELIIKFNARMNMRIIHSWQEDIGFRAAKSRNNAILKSTGQYIILIDGDMILHSKFIQDHIENAEINCFIQGSRVLLSKKLAKKVLAKKLIDLSFFLPSLQNRKNSIHSSLLSKLFSNKTNHLNGIRSCNMSFHRSDCYKVNGFNNLFEGWGREDSEFAARLINSGVQRKNLRFAAIQFHLWHNETSRFAFQKNDEMLNFVIKNKNIYCRDGIHLLEDNEN
jgi:glycosyltransferase involved in cell wall biosynthesis